jgi:hypothetical protein
MRPSRKTTLCDQRNILPKSPAHHGAGWRKHFAHTRSAARPFVADDNNVSFLDFAFKDRPHGRLLAVKDAGRSAESLAFLAADFCDGAFRCEVAPQNDKVAILFKGLANRSNNLLLFIP